MPKHVPVTQTPQQLKSLAEELSQSVATMHAYAQAIEDSGFEKLDITGYGQMKSAIGFVDSYCAAIRNALRKAKEDRGDFAAGSTVKVSKN